MTGRSAENEQMARDGSEAAPRVWAHPGDRLVVRGRRLGEPDRDAEILEALGTDGAPPFRVRWQDSGRESEIFPGEDAWIEHFVERPAGRGAAPRTA